MRILISSYTGLGNFILKTPFIRKLNHLYPNCTIDIVTDKKGNIFDPSPEEIINSSEYIKNVFRLDFNSSIFKKITFFLQLRQNKYNFIFFPFDSSPLFFVVLSRLFFWNSEIIGHLNFNFKTFKSRIILIIQLISFPLSKWVSTVFPYHESILDFI